MTGSKKHTAINSMVVGNGMMAKAFDEFKNDDSIIIFASGVSNSKEKNPEPYLREYNLLDKYKGSSSTLIYFSTCSVFDDSLSGSMYVKFKKDIENFIAENFKNHWIIRLPNVVGKSGNPNTLINFLCNALQNGISFDLHENAYRYFIDIDDVKTILGKIIKDRNLPAGTYNLLYPHPFKIKDLVSQLEEYFNKKALCTRKNEGAFYEVRISDQLIPFTHFDSHSPKVYIDRIIDKYYK